MSDLFTLAWDICAIAGIWLTLGWFVVWSEWKAEKPRLGCPAHLTCVGDGIIYGMLLWPVVIILGIRKW